MNSHLRPISLSAFIGAALVAAFTLAPLYGQDKELTREARWKKVTEAVGKGLPKTAINEIEPIIASALADKAYPEAIKAVAQKISLEGAIEGQKAEEKITRLEAEIEKAKKDAPEMVPVMEAVLANWYWSFFQQNRWRFVQRTQTGGPGGEDILTWDLARILAKIDEQFQTALSHAEVLKKTPIADYDVLLTKGNAPDSFRPTMFDFVAHDSLRFYQAGEQAGSRAIDAFDLMAESPIFSSVDAFLGWEVAPKADSSPMVRALRLLQDLIAFHKDDEKLEALIDADLARLQFGYNKAFGEEKNARYKVALKKFVDAWIDHRISARALHQWASVVQLEGDLVEALKIAKRGAAVHPGTPGGNRCANLAEDILRPAASALTERVWNKPLPKIEVNYKNVTNVHFRIVPFDWEKRLLDGARYRPEQLSQADRKALLRLKPVKEWSSHLPATEDYQMRGESLPVPEDLKGGSYWLIASHDENFTDKNNLVSITDFWVSDLAIVMRTRYGDGILEGFVLNAITGDPLKGATVKAWFRTRNNKRTAVAPVRTDANGLFSLPYGKNRSYAEWHKDSGCARRISNSFLNVENPVIRSISMQTKTPFLTGFPTRLFGSSKRSAQAVLERERRKLHGRCLGEVCMQFCEELPPELVADSAKNVRRRHYPHEVTFWAFLSQVLGEDGSCAKAVSEVQQWYRQRDLAPPSANTTSYVEARQRLPEKMLRRVHRHLFEQLERQTGSGLRWRGHRVKAIDGTSAQMPDSARNQSAYPQPSGQDPGCGFPVVQLVGLLDLNHGGWEDFVESPIQFSETEGLDQLFSRLEEGDILVGDRAYVSYEIVARLLQVGAHFVGRNHHARKIDFRKGSKIGSNQRLQVWRKPHWQTPGSKLSPEEWEQLPEEMTLRIIRVRAMGRDGKAVTRYLVTTLLDEQSYPAEETASLYVHRWEIELRFRDIKTTMRMEMLRTKSPGMIRKELMMHMIAYNALRLLMLKSSTIHGCNHRRLSFKGALQVLSSTAANFSKVGEKPRVRGRERAELMRRIAERVVPNRPGRNEPRNVKRRPKCSRWLQVPRNQHSEHFRYDDHPQKILDECA